VARRVKLALAAELVLGAGVLAVGLTAIAASGSAPSSAPPPTVPTTVPTTSVATTTTAPTTTSTNSTANSTTTTPTTTVGAPAPTAAPVATHRATIDVLAPRPVAAPVRMSILALGVDGPVLPAGVDASNELDVPPDARTLVWYRHGPSPGQRGSAVIAGHLNWRGVTGLFADLAGTPIGAVVTVAYDDGSQRSFVVTSVEMVPKPAVSVNGVFARGGSRVLRLVTCGGEFDGEARSYRSNVVVTAVPA
jgi:hypothetical protein